VLSWEGFVTENLLSVTPPDVDTYFYRTSAGAEIDLILVRGMVIPPLFSGFYK